MISEQLIKDYPKEFILRTERIISQYNEIVQNVLCSKNKENEFFDTTLFINCLYGLLMMPSKLNHNNLLKYKNAKKFLCDNNLEKAIIFSVSNGKEISLEELIRSIRNGMAHWEENEKLGFDYEPKDTGSMIEKIIIKGSLGPKDDIFFTTVTMNISSEESRKNVLKFLKLINCS